MTPHIGVSESWVRVSPPKTVTMVSVAADTIVTDTIVTVFGAITVPVDATNHPTATVAVAVAAVDIVVVGRDVGCEVGARGVLLSLRRSLLLLPLLRRRLLRLLLLLLLLPPLSTARQPQAEESDCGPACHDAESYGAGLETHAAEE